MNFEFHHAIRQVCRACHNICFVHPGTETHPELGYRCESCDAAGYERHNFDQNVTKPEPAAPLPAVEQEAGGEPVLTEPGEQSPVDEESIVEPSDEPATDKESLTAQEPEPVEVVAEEVERERPDGE